MFLLWLRQLPWCGDGTPASVPHPPRAGPVLLTLLLFPPSSIFLPSFAWVYIFFSSGQSWCSACTSVSEGVFLIYPWRDVLHLHLLLCYLQQTRSWSDCDMRWKVDFLDNLEWLAQWLYQEETPKLFPKPSLHQKKVMFSLLVSCSLIHYSFLNSGGTITSEKYAQ